MKPITISLGLLALVFLADFITTWIRHWPNNLKKGTQHILIIGLLFQAVFLGAAIGVLIRSFTRGSP